MHRSRLFRIQEILESFKRYLNSFESDMNRVPESKSQRFFYMRLLYDLQDTHRSLKEHFSDLKHEIKFDQERYATNTALAILAIIQMTLDIDDKNYYFYKKLAHDQRQIDGDAYIKACRLAKSIIEKRYKTKLPRFEQLFGDDLKPNP